MEKSTSNIISVCIVVQNNHRYIRKLLNSMCNLYKSDKIEIIIVDNNSIDDSSKEIDSFKGKLNLIYIHRERQYSLPENRNLCVKNSKGEIIVMVDSDVEFIDKNFFISVAKVFSIKDVSILSPLIIRANDNITQSLGLHAIMGIPYIYNFNFPNMKQLCTIYCVNINPLLIMI